jgi:hypothetical protein
MSKYTVLVEHLRPANECPLIFYPPGKITVIWLCHASIEWCLRFLTFKLPNHPATKNEKRDFSRVLELICWSTQYIQRVLIKLHKSRTKCKSMFWMRSNSRRAYIQYIETFSKTRLTIKPAMLLIHSHFQFVFIYFFLFFQYFEEWSSTILFETELMFSIQFHFPLLTLYIVNYWYIYTPFLNFHCIYVFSYIRSDVHWTGVDLCQPVQRVGHLQQIVYPDLSQRSLFRSASSCVSRNIIFASFRLPTAGLLYGLCQQGKSNRFL